jgi:hypothetical protein
MIQELEKEIRSKLPHLMELSVGQIYGYDEQPYYKVVFVNEEEVCFIDTVHYQKISTLTIAEFSDLDIQVVGHPIALPNVLEWLGIIDFDYTLSNGTLYENDRDYLDATNGIKIDFRKNLLREQSTELIDSLTNLIEKK